VRFITFSLPDRSSLKNFSQLERSYSCLFTWEAKATDGQCPFSFRIYINHHLWRRKKQEIREYEVPAVQLSSCRQYNSAPYPFDFTILLEHSHLKVGTPTSQPSNTKPAEPFVA
jgi:hypothetical protein